MPSQRRPLFDLPIAGLEIHDRVGNLVLLVLSQRSAHPAAQLEAGRDRRALEEKDWPPPRGPLCRLRSFSAPCRRPPARAIGGPYTLANLFGQPYSDQPVRGAFLYPPSRSPCGGVRSPPLSSRTGRPRSSSLWANKGVVHRKKMRGIRSRCGTVAPSVRSPS